MEDWGSLRAVRQTRQEAAELAGIGYLRGRKNQPAGHFRGHVPAEVTQLVEQQLGNLDMAALVGPVDGAELILLMSNRGIRIHREQQLNRFDPPPERRAGERRRSLGGLEVDVHAQADEQGNLVQTPRPARRSGSDGSRARPRAWHSAD